MGSTGTSTYDPAEAIQPPLPADGHGVSAPLHTLIIGSIAAVSLIVGSLMFFNQVPGGIEVGEPIPIPAAAPEADVFVTLQPTGRSGEQEVSVVERGGGRPIDGTVVQIANAVSALGTTGIYTWDEMSTSDDQPERTTCTGHLAVGRPGGHSCGAGGQLDPGVDATEISWGESGERGQNWYEVLVWNAAPEGVWISVETETGARIVSNMINSFGFVEFEGKYGATRGVSVYDANHELLWHKDMN